MRTPCLLLVTLCFAAALRAETAYVNAPVASKNEIDEVLVEGEYPGPGLWKVMRADDPNAHVLWIIAEPPPLPKKMKWKSNEIEEVVRGSQEILLPSALVVKPDERIGFMKGMSLLPTALGARKNPDKSKLKDVLPEELYGRWLALKRIYMPRDRGIERWRPIFAAEKLQGKAFSKSGFRNAEVVRSVVSRLAQQHQVKMTTPSLHFTFATKTIKSSLKAFSREHLDDTECFATTLELVEAVSDTETMSTRAHAWATADLEQLSAVSALPDPSHACAAAFLASTIAQDIIPADIATQMHALWLDQAVKSLTENASTLAVLPLSQLTSTNGYAAKLREKGYVVLEPGHTDAGGSQSAASSLFE